MPFITTQRLPSLIVQCVPFVPFGAGAFVVAAAVREATADQAALGLVVCAGELLAAAGAEAELDGADEAEPGAATGWKVAVVELQPVRSVVPAATAATMTAAERERLEREDTVKALQGMR